MHPLGKQTNLATERRTQPSHPSARERKSTSLTTNRNAAAGSPAWHLKQIYVGSGFDPELRQALNNSFQARGIGLVNSQEQASAILKAEQTRSEEVMVELMSSYHQRLWWMSVKTSSDGSTKSEELAEKIVNDLVSKIPGLRRSGARPQQR